MKNLKVPTCTIEVILSKMSDEELMTYSKLRKIQKEETRKDDLVELDDGFLLSLSNYLETKKKHAEDDREYKNAKRVFEKIISLREDKITEKAKIAAKTNTQVNLDLLPEEQELFRDLKNQFEKHKYHLKNKIDIEHSDTKTNQITEKETEKQEQEKEEKNTNQNQDPEHEENKDGYVKVEIEEDVPEFMGTDLETYGPYTEGDTAKIPQENAEILINRGSAEGA